MVTSSEPDVAFVPCHDPEAEHEEAFVEVHVSVTTDAIGTESAEALKDTDGTGSVGVGVGELPPPPPPPQELMKKTKNSRNEYLLYTSIY